MAEDEQNAESAASTTTTMTTTTETATTTTETETPVTNPNADSESASDDTRKLFIGGLSWETRDEDIRDYFERFGAVESADVKLDPMTGKSRCFAFVVFENADAVEKVMAESEHAINSKKVDVKRARAKPGKIFVGGLKPEMSDDEIRRHFEQYGNVIEFEMPFDKAKNRRKGFGFVTFEREETMKDLLKLRRLTIGEHEVDLRKATPRINYSAAPFATPYGNSYYNWGAEPYYDYYSDYYFGGGFGYYNRNSGSGGKMKKASSAKAEATTATAPY